MICQMGLRFVAAKGTFAFAVLNAGWQEKFMLLAKVLCVAQRYGFSLDIRQDAHPLLVRVV